MANRSCVISVCVCCLVVVVTAQPCLAKATQKKEVRYFYMVTDTSGGSEVKELTLSAGDAETRKLRAAYLTAQKEWGELRKQWLAAVGGPFPVPAPVNPRVQRLTRVSTNQNRYQREAARQKRRLEVWEVCVVKDAEGKLSAEAIRRDKTRRRLASLQRKYVEAGIAWAVKNKGKRLREAKEGDGAPCLPVLSVKKSSLLSEELAAKYAGQLSRQIAELKKKKEQQGPAKPKPGEKPQGVKPKEPERPEPPVEDAKHEGL